MFPSALLAQVESSVLLRQQEEANQRQREADNIAAIASILSSIDHRQAVEDQRRADEEPKNIGQALINILWTQTSANWALAVLAAVAALVGVRTLNAIEGQTKVTRDSVEQADKHFKLVNRQWLHVTFSGCQTRTVSNAVGPHTIFTFQIEVTNQTKMPMAFEKAELFVNSSNKGNHWHQKVLGPEESIDLFPSPRFMERNDLISKHETGLPIVIIGILHYESLSEKTTQEFSTICRLFVNEETPCIFEPMRVGTDDMMKVWKERGQ